MAKGKDPRLEKLKKLYGYELAQARQQHPELLVSDEEVLKNLAVLHLMKSMQDSIVEFMGVVGDEPEDMAVIYGALRSTLEDISNAMTPEERKLADSAYESWRGDKK